MLKGSKCRWVRIFIFFFSFVIRIQSLLAGFDSTYVLTVTQKFAIPEGVENGDYVGKWQKTYTWISKGTITFSIEQNFRNAFSIDAVSGLITIKDASQINGKVVKQDTLIRLLIKTIDAIEGYEIDTARVWVKNSDFVIYIDRNYNGGSENGTRSHPFRMASQDMFKSGKMIAFNRGQVIKGWHMLLSGLISSADKPIIVCAYGAGKKPEFNGVGIPSNSEGWYMGDENNQVSGRVENIFFYDIIMRNYISCAYNVYRTSNKIGWYNCETYNCDKNYVQSPMVISTSSLDDSLAFRPFELINYISDTTGIDATSGNHIKAGVGPVSIINCKFGKSVESAVRFAAGNNSSMKHCLIQTGVYSSNFYNTAIQIRGDGIILEDCIIEGNGTSIGLTSSAGELEMQPDRISIKNCHLKNAACGIALLPPDETYKRDNGCKFENNKITECEIGIRLKNDINTIIRGNLIIGGTNGIYNNGTCTNVKILYNVIYGTESDAILFTNGDKAQFYNNTIIGSLNLTGLKNSTVRNNFLTSLINATTSSNNLSLLEINTTDYFKNYSSHDFKLKSSATKAIGQGFNIGSGFDYNGVSIAGTFDVGAFAYSGNVGEPIVTTPSTNTQPIIKDQEYNIRQQEFNNLFVSNIIAYDNDPGQKLSYTIVSGNGGGLFTLNSQTGELKTTSSNVFNYDRSVYELTVKVTDNGSGLLTNSAKVTIIFLAGSTTVYIDPENTDDPLEDGSASHPFSSWKDVEWIDGNIYLQKNGTIDEVDKIIISADNVSLGAFGQGELPVIKSTTNTYLISGYEKKNISIANLQMESPNAQSCIYFLGSTCNNITIESCILNCNANAIRLVDGNFMTIRYNSIIGANEGVNSTAILTYVYYNLFRNNGTGINIPSGLSQTKIFNNVFINNTISLTASYADITLFNNIFYLSDRNQKALIKSDKKITSDCNIFYPEQGGFVEIANVKYDNLIQLQEGLHTDSHSYNTDPRFVDIFNGDFAVDALSPAINAGLSLNLARDFFNNKVPVAGMPDIGIFESDGNSLKNKLADELKPTMQLYPNPSTGFVNVDIQKASANQIPEAVSQNNKTAIKLLDTMGNILSIKILENTDNLIHENLDLSMLSNGLYYVIYEYLGKTISEKLVLHH